MVDLSQSSNSKQFKLAPPTWSRICATGKKLVFDIMVKQFPLFLFDHCGWKLELLCITDYSSWRKNNLGTDRNWKDVPGKPLSQGRAIDDLDELEPIKKTNDDGPSASNNKLAAKADGKKKMRPGAAKNARNLCAWRWLKQVNETSGTTEEFRMYWAALTPAQQDEVQGRRRAVAERRDVDKGF
ncbi:hypothetical protein BDR07DRAFT_1501621 [Suillus spraguei]|nr:hypothetical protein BDR07DRAFT_1501621 [Suillus spraguei]